MKPRNFYVNNLFNAIKNDNLSLDERNHRAKKFIEAIVATKLAYEKFKQDNPELKIDQEDDVSLDAIDEHGATPLTWASEKGHTEIVEALLKAKADPNKAHEENGETPLILAAGNGHTATVEVLLAAKADLNKTSEIDGTTPLICAASWGYTATAEALLKAKADPNKENKEGDTPLIMAAAYGYIEMVKVLLASKADIDLLNHHGKSALDYSIAKNNIFMVHFLLESNAKINHFEILRKFLLSQDQSDPYVTKCFSIMQKNEAIQIEKLHSLDNAYETYFSYFLQETTLPKNVTTLVRAYDGRFFQSQKLSPINISEPNTINLHLEELKKEILEKTKSTPGLFNANAIQEIDKALALGKSSEMQDTPVSTRMTGMKRKHSE